MNWPWEVLGLDGPAALEEIRRAYAERLRTTRPEDDPDGFQRLNQAYRQACRLAREGPRRDPSGENTPNLSPDPSWDDLPDLSPDDADDTSPPDTPLYPPPDDAYDNGDDMPPDDTPSTSPDDTLNDARSGHKRRHPMSPEHMIWDYERLFAEGDAEERGLRFARTLELRRANQKRYLAWLRGQSVTARQAAEEWGRVSEALRTVETLCAMDAEIPFWREFLKTGLFLRVRDNPDFVFGLEAFLREHPDFPVPRRKLFFLAYDFYKKPVRRRYRPLYTLLRGKPDETLWDRIRRGIASLGKIFLAVTLAVVMVSGGAWIRETRARDRLTGELSTFAAERGYLLRTGSTDGTFPGHSLAGPARTGYYLDLPLTGAGDAIDALGELFHTLGQQDWFRTHPPRYTLYLCWEDWCFYATWNQFDASEARTYYEQRFGADLCRLIALRTGVAEQDMGTDAYTLFALSNPVGNDTIAGETFFHAVGIGTSPAASLRDVPLFHYLLSADAHTLFSIPAERFHAGLTPETLRAASPETRSAEEFAWDITVYRLANTGAPA